MRHPIHPALVHFPIAFLSLAVLADLASLVSEHEILRWSAGFLVLGCGTGVLAMLAGFLELAKVPDGPPLKDCYWHMGFMLSSLTLFGLRLLLGLDNMQPIAVDASILFLDVAGFVCLAAGGWRGGKLVYAHGVGVDKRG